MWMFYSINVRKLVRESSPDIDKNSINRYSFWNILLKTVEYLKRKNFIKGDPILKKKEMQENKMRNSSNSRQYRCQDKEY